MLIGDLDIERAETDSAYLTQVRQFLISTLARKPAKRKTPAKRRKHRRNLRQPDSAKAVAVLAGPRALG